jgi:cytochrome P450
MNVLGSEAVLRPAAKGAKGWLLQKALALAPRVFALLRNIWPIPHLGKVYAVTLYDDVREVFANDRAFAVPYKGNLDVITAGEPFFLGMAGGPEYAAAVSAMHQVMLQDDLTALAVQAEKLAEQVVIRADGQLDVVAGLVRPVTFGVLAPYFGIPEPPLGRLDVWATRLFEFQFAGRPGDTDLRDQVDQIAPAFRAHIDAEILRRKAAPPVSTDVLGRCLTLQADGVAGFSDVQIRTALLCMVVGGPPQPPMVVPQAMEQLLRRPAALAIARAAAVANDDAALAALVREAMRFDPLAPGLPRVTTCPVTVAEGTSRARVIPQGATVIAAFSSAMMDGNRLPAPARFDPHRLEHEYIHFGHGLHECFGRHINRAILHMMLKPLLKRPDLRRAPAPMGHLSKNGIFSERLVVRFGGEQRQGQDLGNI